jgi:Protein of unknown function (DUF3826)
MKFLAGLLTMRTSMKSPLAFLTLLCALTFSAHAQTPAPDAEAKAAQAKAKSDSDQEKKAAEWVASLHLDNPEKEARVQSVIATHLKAVRDWHNEHPFTAVPAGIR